MPSPKARLLPLVDRSSWVLSATGNGFLTANLVDTAGNAVCNDIIGSAMLGWDTTLDTEGTPWVVFVSADTNCVTVRRASGGIWGPSLQVSSQVGQDPRIRADEFNNVWVFWMAESASGSVECRACRMGPRSGQEMVASTFTHAQHLLDAGCRGGDIWILVSESAESSWIVRGTEHGGFQPTRLLDHLA